MRVAGLAGGGGGADEPNTSGEIQSPSWATLTDNRARRVGVLAATFLNNNSHGTVNAVTS